MWAVGRDRLRTAREVAALAGTDPSVAALEAFHSVQVALSAIDRLEVRGRDSAGLHLLVRHHGLELDDFSSVCGKGLHAAVDDVLARDEPPFAHPAGDRAVASPKRSA